MTNILVIFSILSLINVMFSTVRSLTTIKCGKGVASIVSAGYFAFYNIVLIYTVADFPLWEKCVITFACNLIGVFIVKFIEEKMHKDKMWVYNCTAKVAHSDIEIIANALKEMNIKLVYNEVVPNRLYSLQVFSNSQKESLMIKSVLSNYNIHFNAYETKETN